ncbi:MAG: nuclear transport factor 2 family protein [Porticoccaceae bacterium]|jgi:ketosteroid isomerase-like protein|nr:nuclear transport factor 2 family protein [Porticoccaceae bacterium]
MRIIKIIVAFCFVLSSTVFANDHSSAAEAEVLKAVNVYMQARNDRDFKTVVALSSKNGTLDTNSDGSFHKPLAKPSIESWQKSGPSQIQYFYPEVIQIATDVVHVRLYAEGMVGPAGQESDYRTRVTMNWIKEDGSWVLKSAHYSSANYGGVHKTQVSDFDN